MLEFLAQSDNIGRLVALLLLLMSVASWVVIFWKGWLLSRIMKDVRLAIPAFWQAPDLKQAAQRVAHSHMVLHGGKWRDWRAAAPAAR